MSEPSEPYPPTSTRREWPLSWLAVFVVACVAAVAINYTKTFSDCMHEHKNDKNYQTLHQSIGVFSTPLQRMGTRARLVYACVGDFTDKNNGGIVALATLLVGFFTFTLWRSTERLWRASLIHASHAEKAIQVAEQSAKLQLRAYLSDTPVEIIVSVGGEEIEIQFLFQNENHGYTPARDVRHFIHAQILPHPLAENVVVPPALEETARSPITMASRMTRVATGNFFKFTEADFQEVYTGTVRRLYVFATTRYNDIYGEPHEIGVCVNCGGPEFKASLERARNAAGIRFKARASWDFQYGGGAQHNYEW